MAEDMISIFILMGMEGSNSFLSKLSYIIIACSFLLIFLFLDLYRDIGLKNIAYECDINPNCLYHFRTRRFIFDHHGDLFEWTSAMYKGTPQPCFESDTLSFQQQIISINNSISILPDSLMQRINDKKVTGKVLCDIKKDNHYTDVVFVLMDKENNMIDFIIFED